MKRDPAVSKAWRWPVAVLGATLLASWAFADQIKIGNFWYKDALVKGIEGGQVTHLNEDGASVNTKLERVRGLKIDRYPRLAVAQKAFDEQENEKAFHLLASLVKKIKEPWLRDWVLYRQFQVAQRLSQTVEATDILLQLMRHGADPYYFVQSDQMSFDQLVPEDAEQIEQLLAKAQAKQVGLAGQLVEDMRSRLNASPRLTRTVSKPMIGTVVPGSTIKIQHRSSVVTLSKVLDLDDAITRKLVQGQYDAALADLEPELNGSTKYMSLRLYQRAMGQLALAEAHNDRKRYMDCALDMMRIMTYFPTSRFVGPALLETGYIHQKIGRPDLAQKLLESARNYIDQETDPALAQRLEHLSESR